ncbi:unnamed protein product [Phaeothamnion confervicola]
MNAPAAARFQPQDPGYAARCRDSFSRQKAMALIGGAMGAMEPGYCEILLPFRGDLTQQKGFVHGGIIGMIADSACGYAAFSLMPADCSLVTVEYKINILAPAVGERLVARGEVMRPGRTLTVARAEVYAETDGRSVHCASMQQTLMMLAGRSDHPD